MSTLHFKIKSYEVILGHKIGSGLQGLAWASAWITCNGQGGEKLIVTFAPDVSAAKNYTAMVDKRAGIVAPMSSFPAYIDILRNEKPVYGQMDDTYPDNLNLITTLAEAVGEGELGTKRRKGE